MIGEIPDSKGNIPGTFYSRILPELSATVSVSDVKNKGGKVVAHELLINVNDAGDAIAGAIAAVKGHHKKTSSKGEAKIKLGGSTTDKVGLTITAPGYRALKKTIKPSDAICRRLASMGTWSDRAGARRGTSNWSLQL